MSVLTGDASFASGRWPGSWNLCMRWARTIDGRDYATRSPCDPRGALHGVLATSCRLERAVKSAVGAWPGFRRSGRTQSCRRSSRGTPAGISAR